MPDDILNAASELGAKLRDSDEYRAFSNALIAINKNYDAKQKIFEYKNIQMEYANRGQIMIGEEKHLSKLYFDLCLIPDAKYFLQSEKAWLKLMHSVREVVFSGTEPDYI